MNKLAVFKSTLTNSNISSQLEIQDKESNVINVVFDLSDSSQNVDAQDLYLLCGEVLKWYLLNVFLPISNLQNIVYLSKKLDLSNTYPVRDAQSFLIEHRMNCPYGSKYSDIKKEEIETVSLLIDGIHHVMDLLVSKFEINELTDVQFGGVYNRTVIFSFDGSLRSTGNKVTTK